MTALLVDDEARARRTLAALLEEFCEDVEVCAMAGSVSSALEAIAKQRPDVVFLDIHMPGQSGFALAEAPELADLPIVFTTAHADHAVRAFRVRAVDYLLKPIDVQQLRQALTRVRELIGDGVESAARRQLIFYAGGQQQIVALDDVDYLMADGSYTYVVTGERKHLVARPLGDFTPNLEAAGFFRVHRSYLVNIAKVTSVGPSTAPNCTLRGERTVPVSRYRRNELLEALEKR